MARGSKPGERRGGRAPGVPNRRTLELTERLTDLGCDPLEGLAKIAADPSTDVVLRARVYADLLPYLYPKRKAIELSMERQNLFDGVPLADVLRIKERLTALVRKDGEAPTPGNRFGY